jgi:hypothetical protein
VSITLVSDSVTFSFELSWLQSVKFYGEGGDCCVVSINPLPGFDQLGGRSYGDLQTWTTSAIPGGPHGAVIEDSVGFHLQVVGEAPIHGAQGGQVFWGVGSSLDQGGSRYDIDFSGLARASSGCKVHQGGLEFFNSIDRCRSHGSPIGMEGVQTGTPPPPPPPPPLPSSSLLRHQVNSIESSLTIDASHSVPDHPGNIGCPKWSSRILM